MCVNHFDFCTMADLHVREAVNKRDRLMIAYKGAEKLMKHRQSQENSVLD